MPTKNPIIGIYSLECNLTGKSYVGSSVDILKRFNSHIRQLENGRHHSYKLQRHWNRVDFQQDGVLNLYILEECNREDLPEKELNWILELQAVANGFNVNYDTRRVYKRKRRKGLD